MIALFDARTASSAGTPAIVEEFLAQVGDQVCRVVWIVGLNQMIVIVGHCLVAKHSGKLLVDESADRSDKYEAITLPKLRMIIIRYSTWKFVYDVADHPQARNDTVMLTAISDSSSTNSSSRLPKSTCKYLEGVVEV